MVTISADTILDHQTVASMYVSGLWTNYPPADVLIACVLVIPVSLYTSRESPSLSLVCYL